MEIDIVLQQAGALHLVECKSSATAHSSFFEPLSAIRDLIGATSSETAVAAALVYGGKESHPRRTIPVYSWCDIEKLSRRIAG
jgi:hypothetical protein